MSDTTTDLAEHIDWFERDLAYKAPEQWLPLVSDFLDGLRARVAALESEREAGETRTERVVEAARALAGGWVIDETTSRGAMDLILAVDALDGPWTPADPETESEDA